MADIKKYPGMHPIRACSFHDYGCRNAITTDKRKRRQPSALLMAIPLQQGQVFNHHWVAILDHCLSQSLCSRDKFLIYTIVFILGIIMSQSLCSRDKFLMQCVFFLLVFNKLRGVFPTFASGKKLSLRALFLFGFLWVFLERRRMRHVRILVVS